MSPDPTAIPTTQALVLERFEPFGASTPRPDAGAKTRGEFVYASDLDVPGGLHAMTVRSPHARARILSIDVAEALALPGVHAVLTHADVPGRKHYGLMYADQPVLAIDEVRYFGEPVALVAADDPENARRAVELVHVEYEPLEPQCDPWYAARNPQAADSHPSGNVVRHQPVVVGAVDDAVADVVVRGEYEVGMQDQAPLGPEAGTAFPTADGGVEVHVATQWLHVDREQIAPCLDLPEDRVKVCLAGVGGAFGAREDISVQIHIAMLALRTGRPVRMVLPRHESFVGHVHRHPAKLRYEHGATADGRLVYVKAEIVIDGGAYTSSTFAVVGNVASFAVGPYEVPNARVDVWGVRTNNPPCGAMRGFGAVQVCIAYEAQMDRLARELAMDPVELRIRNVVSQGSAILTGQRVHAPAPLAEMLRTLRDMPVAPAEEPDSADGPTVRGVGYALGIKNVAFSEGFDDYSTARVALAVHNGQSVATVATAAAEVGQGGVAVQATIAQTELGVARVVLVPADTDVGSAGSTSSARQSLMTGGAVKAACEAVRERLYDLVRSRTGRALPDLRLADGKVVSGSEGVVASVAEILDGAVIEETRRYHHRATSPLDPVTGQGDSHVQLAFCAHRAVVEVDPELGRVRVADLAVVQDVGRVLNRIGAEGQLHGGTVQGVGLALSEEVAVRDGVILNPGFGEYVIPAAADVPPMTVFLLESADEQAPYGLRGVGEVSAVSSTPAVAAAVRDATGRALTRVPIRPWDLVL